MERIRIGIVGLHFGHHIVKSLRSAPAQEYFELAGLCDLDAHRLRRVVEETGVRAYRDLDELLCDSTIPALGLFTPPNGRAALIRRCIRAGKHVMTTKPFELDAAAGLAVLREARQLGRVVHLNSPAPTLSPDLRQIKTWRDKYGLGLPVGCRADVWARYREKADGTWYDDPARCPVAPIFRLGIYLINDLVGIFGSARRVQVLSSRLFTGRPTPDNAQLGIEFKNGGLANIFASFCVGDGDHYRNSLALNFENGTVYRNCGPIRAEGGSAEMWLVMMQDKQRRLVEQARFDGASGHYQWEVFHRAIRGDTIPEEIPPEQVAAGIGIIRAMAAAAAGNGTAEVEAVV